MARSKTDAGIGHPADEGTAALAHAVALIQQQCEEVLEQVKAMRTQLSELAAREADLRVVLERDTELEPLLDRLGKTLEKTSTAGKVAASIDGAELHLEPFPYAIIDNFLPAQLYGSLLRGIPPARLFTSKGAGKEHLPVPFGLAPAYAQRVWSYLANELIPNVIAPRLAQKFRAQIDEWISRNWPDVDPGSVMLHGSGGRIMLRRRGYRILPHRDPKWSFITCIFYLARPDDDSAWGTQLYAVEGDEEAKNAAPHWIDQKKCRLADDVKFLPNRLLVFLNSVGAHGAFIPPDAEPEHLERYIYQFRVGPPVETIAMLKSMLPEERLPLWAGKALVDY